MAGLFLVGLPGTPGLAQDNPPQAEQDQAPKPAQAGDSVASRLDRLEEKVNDLQVMVGTLESFIRAKPGTTLPQEAPPQAAPAQSGQGELGPRIDALEVKITALTSQIEQIGRQMSALEAKLAAAPPQAPLPPAAEPVPERQGEAPTPPSDNALAAAPGNAEDNGDTSKPRWYGPKPGSDQVAALLEEQAAQKPSDSEPQSLAAALPGGDAQSLYQQGYGALLQKDYAGAEGAFRQLLDTHPNDPLAADAQYWIGETYYVRGQYKNAADAFLKGYKKYKGGQKAPDTLLKLGMSLAELGQKDAACSTFTELKTKYPAAPEHISDEAKAWRKKTGC
jgi:tol-pal system protein YbgF